MIKHVIHIKNGIMIHVNVSLKSSAHAKMIVVGIPAHAIVRIAGI